MVHTVLPSRIFDNGPGSSPLAGPPNSHLFRPRPSSAEGMNWHESRMMSTSVAAATGLRQQKSDCETFVSTHVAAAPRSTDVDARADINEVMTMADAECERVARRHDHDDPSFQRAWLISPACQTWSAYVCLPLRGPATNGRAALVTVHWLHRVRGRRGLLTTASAH